MQRKALKQLGKVTQWTNEKVFSGEKTQLSDEFTDFEKDIDVRRIGIERLHATSLPFFHQLTKAKPTADPYPPSGSGKDKISYTEALGLVMIDHGGDVRGTYGDGLGKYGRARCKLAMAQEEFGQRLSEGYIGGMESALEAVNEYKTYRKKLDSRRLALDSAITRLHGNKKEKEAYKLEQEVETAKERFEEIEEETQARMVVIQEQEERQWAEITDLLEAELEYFAKCKDILEELRDQWPSGSVAAPSANRPRAKSNASARSLNRQATTRNMPRNLTSDEEDTPSANRSRSGSNASSTGKARRMLPSFGSLGKKGGLASIATGGGSKKKTFGREKDRYEDESRQALNSEEDEDEVYSYHTRPPASPINGRARSSTTLSASRVSLASNINAAVPPPMRRTHTTPSNLAAKYVKALYDFAGEAEDELAVRAGEIIEVKKEVSGDWWIGELNGRSGLFPATYCEPYVPTPTTPVAPRPVPPRALPPPAAASRFMVPASPDPGMSEPDTDGYSDNEHASQSQSLTMSSQAPASYRPPPVISKKAAPPPPPPSRRSQSSSNLLSSSASQSYLAPPQPAFRKTASPEGSPFGGSEDDLTDEGEIFGGSGKSTPASFGSPPIGANAAANGPGLSHGLGNIHLARAPAGDAKDCKACDCQAGEFVQNLFKPQGTCASCFHQH